ncbi:hypothetical protein Q5M87_13105 [Brachyspira innocens]|uniref:hypothetical protein n=1 Tax=Brachyspira innocens TaxID=13264 RepID=UPI00035E368A|nr:hypothetical protein [Brachyspira innocens]MDO6994946.1 hypothetical protein [Brachyspira innocens]
MKKIFYLSLFFIIILISCNIYVNDNIGILIFDEDTKGNRLTNETLTFILLKREDKNSFNNITYISGEIYNKNGSQNIKYIEEAKYIKDIKDTNSFQYLNIDNNKMMIDYNKKRIIFIDYDGNKYTLPLNNSEDTWVYKLLSDSTNL